MNIDNKQLMLAEFTKLTQEVIHWWVHNLDLTKQHPSRTLHGIMIKLTGEVKLVVQNNNHPEYVDRFTLVNSSDEFVPLAQELSMLWRNGYYENMYKQCPFIHKELYTVEDDINTFYSGKYVSYCTTIKTNIDLINFIKEVEVPYQYLTIEQTEDVEVETTEKFDVGDFKVTGFGETPYGY